MTGTLETGKRYAPGDFSAWPLGAQQALYLDLARQSLRCWDLDVEAVCWLAYSTNAIFAVRAADARFVLRLSLPGRVSEAGLRAELEWLRAIRRRTHLLAPNPVPLVSDGQKRLYVSVTHERLPPPHSVYCALFGHIAGHSKSARELSAADCCQIGRYLGKLHQDAQFGPPIGSGRPRLDKAGLFGEDSPYQSAHEDQALDAGQRAVFARVAQRVGDVMARLDGERENFGLIHADLLAKNVLFDGDQIAALDFEYSGWGYFLYDLAPLLWQLRGERRADYAPLEAALLAGYQSQRVDAPLDREALEAFIAARQLASCRWLLQNLHHPQVRDAAPALMRQRTAELEAFLGSGVLQRRSPTL